MMPMLLPAQEISGGWYGRADVLVQGSHSNYLAELNIRQKGKEVEGVMGYYFRNTYQSFIVRGKYDPKTRTVTIPEVPVAYFNASAAMPAVHCMMEFTAQLSVSRMKSSLKGLLMSDAKYRYTCPDIDIRLTRDDDENTDSLLQAFSPANRIWLPAADEMVVSSASVIAQKEAPAVANITQSFATRQAFLIREIDVYSDSVRVSIYDNGDVDGDTVSIFYNKAPILVNQGLNTQGVNLYLSLDSTTEVHELSLYAENMGTIPPNTALMIIHDGVNRHELFSTSNETLNGTVRIRRVRKAVARN
jgi:hypothetical protein